MKNVVTKNKVIVTVLALLIAVAGYLNYTDILKIDEKKLMEENNILKNGEYTYEVDNEVVNEKKYDDVYTDDKRLKENDDIESLDKENEDEPGDAIFTNGSSVNYGTVKAKVNREQVRSKNKSDLLKIIENQKIDDENKKSAVDAMVEITKNSELENEIETILQAKGYNDLIVSLSDKQADVIVSDMMDESDRAVIEDVVSRKTGLGIENIVITPTN